MSLTIFNIFKLQNKKKNKDKDHKKFSREKEYNKDKDTQKKAAKVIYEFELKN